MIHQLLAEHRLIVRVLVLFARHCEHMLAARTPDVALTRAFLCFFRDFGGERHHAKEERLFAWMNTQGLDQASGPLAVLHHEHEEGRDLLRAVTGAINVLEVHPRSKFALHEVHHLALRYVELMMVHIEKEEDVLFPIAEYFAQQSGTECEIPAEMADEAQAWLDELDTRAGAWPQVTLQRKDLGTPYQFARLCEESLN